MKRVITFFLATAIAVTTGTVSAQPAPFSPNNGASYSSMDLTQLANAAKDGNAEAQFYLGTRYKMGQGIQADAAKAFFWYKKAADQGVAAAQLNVGQMSAEGVGTRKNLEMAQQYLEQAAKQGDNRASYNLALLEERARNYASAYKWYDVSSRDGMLDYNVKAMSEGKIIKLATNMSRSDIQTARDRADRWLQGE